MRGVRPPARCRTPASSTREDCRAHPKPRASARGPFPRLWGKAGMGAIRSRAYAHEAPSPACGGRPGWGPSEIARHAHEAPSPVHGGRLGWGHSAVAPDAVLRYGPTPPTQPPPAAQGEECQVHPKSRVHARSPFLRLRGKAGMGAFWQSHPTPCLATARCPPPRLLPRGHEERRGCEHCVATFTFTRRATGKRSAAGRASSSAQGSRLTGPDTA
jgi:hypothetical protein